MMCLFLLLCLVSQLSLAIHYQTKLARAACRNTFFERYGGQQLVLQASHYFMNLKSKMETVQKPYLVSLTSIYMHAQRSSGIRSLKNILRAKNRLSILRDWPIIESEGLRLQSSKEDYVWGIRFELYITYY